MRFIKTYLPTDKKPLKAVTGSKKTWNGWSVGWKKTSKVYVGNR